MDTTRKKYIEFIYSDIVLSESSKKVIENRVITKVEVSEKAIGFRFFDTLETTIEVDGKPVKLMSERIDESAMFYYGGRVYTREELAQEASGNQTLLDNMDRHGWNKVIKTRMGNFRPFKDTDILISIDNP